MAYPKTKQKTHMSILHGHNVNNVNSVVHLLYTAENHLQRHMCAHFSYKVVHCGKFVRWILDVRWMLVASKMSPRLLGWPPTEYTMCINLQMLSLFMYDVHCFLLVIKLLLLWIVGFVRWVFCLGTEVWHLYDLPFLTMYRLNSCQWHIQKAINPAMQMMWFALLGRCFVIDHERYVLSHCLRTSLGHNLISPSLRMFQQNKKASKILFQIFSGSCVRIYAWKYWASLYKTQTKLFNIEME